MPLYDTNWYYVIYSLVFHFSILTIAVGVIVILFIIIDTSLRRPESLISAVGLLVIVVVTFFSSKDPRQASVKVQ